MKTFSQFKKLNENFGGLSSPPMILVLRRTAIRLFPSGQKVALFRNENYNIEISVPYTDDHFSGKIPFASPIGEEIIIEGSHGCECEHESHFEKHKLSPNGNPNHKYGVKFAERAIVPVKTPYGTFKVCHDCAKDCLQKYYNQTESALHHLHSITKTRMPREVVFRNGARKSVDHQTAANIMKLHSKLNTKNKTKVETLINTDPSGLHKIAQFAKANLE